MTPLNGHVWNVAKDNCIRCGCEAMHFLWRPCRPRCAISALPRNELCPYCGGRNVDHPNGKDVPCKSCGEPAVALCHGNRYHLEVGPVEERE